MRFAHRMTTCALLVIWGWAGLAVAEPPKPATEDEIKALLAKAKESKDDADADQLFVLDEADVYVKESGLATTESCQVIKLLTPTGVARHSVLRFDFDPATRRVTVRGVRVHKKDGTLTDIPLHEQVTQPTPQDIIFWGGEQHLVNIPNLQVGDAIEVRVSRIGFNIAYLDESGTHSAALAAAADAEANLQPPMPGHWYEVTLFQGDSPILQKRYTVHLPRSMTIQYEVYNGPVRSSRWLTDTHEIYTFTAEDVPAMKREPHQVAADDCAAKVVLATVPDWPTKSRWFHQVNEPQFEADEAIRAKVAEITRGLTSLEDKIAACNHWVADNIRYYGTSRGPCEGFTLHTGIETFRDRGGVCKDKAGMLVTMLRVLGVEAYPALTMAGSRVERIPADQFNHTVTVYRDAEGKFVILDPTWIPYSREMWSSREAEQGLVYGTPDGEDLTLSPYYPPSYNALTAKANSMVSPDGTLRTRIQMDMKGYPCTYLRRAIGRTPPADLKGAFESVMAVAPNARLEQFQHIAADDYSRDGFATLDISASRYAAGQSEVRLLNLPLLSFPLGKWLYSDLLEKLAPGERKYAYRLRATRGLHFEERLELPAGWKVDKLPEAKSIENPTALLKFEATAEGNAITYTLDFEARQHQVAAADYGQLQEALTALQALGKTRIVCRVGETSPSREQAAGNKPRSEVVHD